MFDFEHSIEEDRYIAIGKVGDVLFVVFTERKDVVRLISARLATNAERGLIPGLKDRVVYGSMETQHERESRW